MIEKAALRAEEALQKLQVPHYELPEGFREHFQDKLAFCLLLILGMPGVMCFGISLHPSTRYWVGRQGAVAAIVCLVWVFIGHRVLFRKGVNRSVAVGELLVIPAVGLAMVGESYRLFSLDVISQLGTEDCAAFPGKQKLEAAWVEANELLRGCIAEQAAITGSPVEEIEQVTVVQRCPDYKDRREAWAAEWDYLQLLEERERCYGWCKVRQPVWVTRESDLGLRGGWDRCSLVAAQSLNNKVYRVATQIIFFSVVGLLVTCVLLSLVHF